MKPVNLVLFGDQAVEKLTSIQALVRNATTSHGAKRLLQEATDLLQIHLKDLDDIERAWNHEVNSLLGLAEDNLAEEAPNAVIATVLMCIGRLGEIICFAEEDPDILGSENDPVQVLAYCTGLLPAAALLAARDTNELLDLAKEIISITFRMSVAIQRRLTLIEDSNQSWAATLVGKSTEEVQHILDNFHETNNVPFSKRVAISVVSRGWMTITGAPSSLSNLMYFSKVLNDCPKIKTDTKAAHTPYVPPIDIDAALGSSQLLDLPITGKAKMLSPSSCQPYEHTTLRSLLAGIIEDIVSNKLLVDDTADACIQDFRDRRVRLIVAGPTAHLPAVERSLKTKAVDYSISQHGPGKSAFSRGGSDLIAVVGMSTRLPGSDNVDEFFENLMAGRIELKKIPKSRFDIELHHDPEGNKRHAIGTTEGAFLERPGFFDNRLFSISPREALQMDPLQRLLLTTSWEALEMAGYSRDATPSTQGNRIATYFGQAANDWRDVMNNDDIDIYYVPGLSRPFGPGRLAYHHKWGGGTYSIDSACATSTTAVHLACQALASRECDTAIAGGGSLCISPMTFAGLSKSGMISNRGGCRTFHDDADGYARGEGVGVVVLKRLEDAELDNDNILGVIRGHARTYTTTSTSITHPSAESQARIYREVLRQSAVDPNEIVYAEMHGTGTQAGDFEEMRSVIEVLGQQRTMKNPLTVGAVKACVGHGEGAAGVTSLIKVLMMLQEKKIPPQPGLPFRLNRNFPNLEALNVRIAGLGSKDLTLRASPVAMDGRIKCLISTFDASGGNTSLVVEQAPAKSSKTRHPLAHHVIAVSGKTAFSIQHNKQRLLDYLTKYPMTSLADLSYSTTARRMHEVLRAAYTGQSIKDIIAALREDISAGAQSQPKKPKASKVVFAFTGQGSQYASMGKHLFAHSATLREMLQCYEQMCIHQGLPGFLHYITDVHAKSNPTSATVLQLALVALEIATANLLKSWGIRPHAVIGHSLGEYSALCIAGVLSVSDTLYLVGQRAELMEQKLVAGEFAMLAIRKNAAATRTLLAEESLYAKRSNIACFNAPQVTVISGPKSEIEHIQSKLEAQGSRSTLLRTSYGFHSAHVEAILPQYEAIARAVHFATPVIPIASTLLGKVIEAGQGGVFSASYLIRQAREAVRYVDALQALEKYAVGSSPMIMIEVGPEPTCTGLAQQTLVSPEHQFLVTMRSSENNWKTITAMLSSLYRAGTSIDWMQYHKHHLACLSLLRLPAYAFDEKDFWKPFVAHVCSSGTNAVKDEKALRAAPAFSTTSLHLVEEEIIEDGSISVNFVSQVSEPHLYEAIQGHVVNGTAIVSMSIFCDMAKSAAQYAYRRIHQGQAVPPMTMHDLDMKHAVVVRGRDDDQVMKTRVVLRDNSDAVVTFVSVRGGTSSSVQNGEVRIAFGNNAAWLVQHAQTSFLIDARIKSLKDMAMSGMAHYLRKAIAYRLFGNLVEYGEEYKAMQEVWLDGQHSDAVSIIKLNKYSGPGKFLYNPFWADGATHLGGLLLNSGLSYDQDTVFLCTSFDSWHEKEELRPDIEYTTYAMMQESDTPNILSGSVYIFNAERKLIQLVTGIRFQKMKRLALETILRVSSKTTSEKQTPIRPSSPLHPDRPLTPRPKETPSTHLNIPGRPLDPNLLTPAASTKGYDSDQEDPSFFATLKTSQRTHQTDYTSEFFSILVAECGCSEADLDSATHFADVGLDSLLAITIISMFRKKTGVDLHPSFFLDNPTVGEARIALSSRDQTDLSTSSDMENDGSDDSDVALSSRTSIDAIVTHDGIDGFSIQEREPFKTVIHPPSPVKTRASEISTITSSLPEVNSIKSTPPSESILAEAKKPSKAILLHGNPQATGPRLFLFPDGSGSPSAYIQLPSLHRSINVYALQSPFVKNPTEFTCSVNQICRSFVEALRAVQPHGPYLLGGFSYGALYAYEVSRLLLADGEIVEGLCILDMAVPNATSPDFGGTQEELNHSGLLPRVSALTKAQKEHIAKTISAMTTYTPVPLPPSQQPRRTVLLCSKDGLGADSQTELARWAAGSKSASRGWENLLSGEIKRKDIEGSHFSFMRYPTVKVLGDVWADILVDVCSLEK